MNYYLKLFLTQATIFCLAAIYYRAIASGVYPFIFGSAVLYSANNYVATRNTAGNKCKWGFAAIVVGSGLGSCVGVLITHALHGGVK